jgi:hypothetical protein
MRLPGTGDGVARLVEVSIVKVDMNGLLAGPLYDNQSHGWAGSSTIGNFNALLFFSETSALARCPRGHDWSFSMVDRHWLGDLGIAILLSLPLAAVTLPNMSVGKSASISTTASLSLTGDLAAHGRISLLD